MEELYNRQESMRLNIPNSMAIIGLGGGGSWVAISFALLGVKRLLIIDKDTVEESNLNRTLFRYSDIGKPKTQAVKELILERRPKCIVDTVNELSTKLFTDYEAGLSETFADIISCDCIIDATDNYNTRDIMIRLYMEFFQSIDGRYCKLGYNGQNFEIDWSFSHIEDSLRTGYRIVNTYLATPMVEVASLMSLITSGAGRKECLYKGNVSDMINRRKSIAQNPVPVRYIEVFGYKYKSLTQADYESLKTGNLLYIKDFSNTRKAGINVPQDMDILKGRLVGYDCISERDKVIIRGIDGRNWTCLISDIYIRVTSPIEEEVIDYEMSEDEYVIEESEYQKGA